MGWFNKSSSTVQQTTTQQYDQRQVYDAGGGIVGEGNLWDQSVYLDTSNRSTTNVDTSNRSSTNITSDSSNRSTTNVTTVDAGTVDLAKSAMLDAVKLAQNAQQGAASTITSGVKDSYAFATSNAKQAYETNRDAMGFAETAFDKVTALAKDVTKQAGAQAAAAADVASAAYANAADSSTGNKTLIYVAIAAVALVAGVPVLASFLKR